VTGARRQTGHAHRRSMHVDQDSSQAAPPRLLVAADTAIDPHRLVAICSDHAGAGTPSVSLLVPVDLESRASSESAARAEGLLRSATALLDAAGIRLEDIVLADDDADLIGQLVRSGGFDALLVCPAGRKASSPVLPLAVRLARLHGIIVDVDGRGGGRASLVRRVVRPLTRRMRPWH
jgi:hypothetical protein